ncbi:hypothetical protein ACVGW7_06785, partial [Enterobacter intestinihominis]
SSGSAAAGALATGATSSGSAAAGALATGAASSGSAPAAPSAPRASTSVIYALAAVSNRHHTKRTKVEWCISPWAP